MAALASFAESESLDEAGLATTAASMLEDFTRTAAVMYRPAQIDGGFELAALGQAATPPGLIRDFARFVATANATSSFVYNPLRPRPHERNRVLRLVPSMVVSTPLLARVFDGNGLGRAVQTRMLICAGPVLLGWIGTFRDPSSEVVARRDAWAVHHLARALRRPLRLIRQLPPSGLGPSFETALDALAGDAYFVTESGRIELANARGAAHLEASYAAVAQAVARALEMHRRRRASADYEVHPVRDRRAHLYIVHRRLDGASRLAARLYSARVQWDLSDQQLAVLALLARGESNKEMAASLDLSVRTVEAHVNAAIKKAGADSRLRLLAMLWTSPGEDGGTAASSLPSDP